MQTYKNNWFKYTLGFITCMLIRFIPFRPPNIEPVLATVMPFSKSYTKLASFFFGFLSIVLYDILTSKIGIWTFVTALAYGFLGLWAVTYFKNKTSSRWNYAKFAVIGTIAYDIVTGLTIGPIFFHQTFMQALIGQIPFTALHLIGNVGFAILLSPLVHKFIVENKSLSWSSFISAPSPKQI